MNIDVIDYAKILKYIQLAIVVQYHYTVCIGYRLINATKVIMKCNSFPITYFSYTANFSNAFYLSCIPICRSRLKIWLYWVQVLLLEVQQLIPLLVIISGLASHGLNQRPLSLKPIRKQMSQG